MRYAIALGVAAAMIGATFAAMLVLKGLTLREIRAELRRAKDAGDPWLADIDPETFVLQDVGLDLPTHLKVHIGITDAIERLWFVWIPLTVAGCLAAAYFISQAKGRQ